MAPVPVFSSIWLLAYGLAVAKPTSCGALVRQAPAQAVAACASAAEEAIAAHRRGDAIDALLHLSEAWQLQGRYSDADAALARLETLYGAQLPAKDRFRLERRRGIVAFRRNDLVAAMRDFRAAETIAQGLGDADRATVLNDLGVLQRRLGDYAEALRYLTASLDLKRRAGLADQLGSTLDNIGQVYLESDDLEGAEAHFRDAIAAHVAARRPLMAAHSRESLGLLFSRRGDAVEAARALESAWQAFVDAGAPVDAQRSALHRAELAAAAHRSAELSEWLTKAAVTGDGPRPLAFDRLSAEVEASNGRTAAALAHLEQALSKAREPVEEERSRALARLTQWAVALGDYRRAFDFQRQAWASELRSTEQRRSETLDRLRTRFDLVRHERERARLEAENARQAGAIADQRRLQSLIAATAAVAALLLFGLHRRRVWQLRIESERRQAGLQSELDRFRDAAERLRSDRRTLRRVLDEIGDALLLIDAGGNLRFANRPARRALGLDETDGDPQSPRLDDLLGGELAERVRAHWLAAADGGDGAPLILSDADARQQVWLLPLELEEELMLVGLGGAQAGPSERVRDAIANLRATAEPETPERRRQFRRDLVDLMVATLDAWESSTRRNRLDLAERSGVWRISIDDGRLRARTMERYLSPERLPEHPRWREVLRTAYFVLAECPLEEDARDRLRSLAERVKSAAP